MKADIALAKQLSVLAVLVLCSISATVRSEELPRRGFLGVRTVAIEEETQGRLKLHSTEGALVRYVVPDSPADRGGILPEDVIVRVYDRIIPGPAELDRMIENYRGGDEFELLVLRGGKEEELRFELDGILRESPEDLVVEYRDVEFDGTRHRTLWTSIGHDRALPTIVLLQDLRCQSIDLPYTDHHPYKQLVYGLARAGYLVIRVEKRGVGDSEGAPCLETDFEYEVDLFDAVVADLLESPRVEPGGLFLFGHGIGGAIAPIIASRREVAGIAVYGSPARGPVSWIDVEGRKLQLEGWSPADIAEELEPLEQVLHRIRWDRWDADRIRSEHPRTDELLEDGLFRGRRTDYFAQLFDRNLLRDWQDWSGPTLVLFGDEDIEANITDSEWIVRAVDESSAGLGTLVVIEASDHRMHETSGLEASLEGSYLREFQPRILSELSTWLRSRGR